MRHVLRNAGWLLLAGTVAPLGAARGQLIEVRTVPLATGEQFALFPSARAGMGGVSIALEDPLLDPFVNPARGADVDASRVFGAPIFYDITQGDGSARALPVGVLLHSPTWFGGMATAIQQIVAPQTLGGYWGCPPGSLCVAELDRAPGYYYPPPPPQTLSEHVAGNMYAFASVGRTLNDRRTALGASVFWGGLNAMDGVDLLYPGSDRIDQYGHVVDYRVGLLRDLGAGRTLALLGVHDRVTMTHDVTYTSYLWVPCPLAPDTLPPGCPVPQIRTDKNLDWTRTWGIQGLYRQPLTAPGWRIGGVLTANYKTHPHIPNYELMNIPRDPGHSWALSFGPGIARTTGETTFGMDLLFEPIWSHTWAKNTVTDTTRATDNDFAFQNVRLRLGVAQQARPVGFELGLDVYAVNYVMHQQVATYTATTLPLTSERRQQENWMEWTPTWGLSLTVPGLTVRYVGRLTAGAGRPGVASGSGLRADALANAGGDYVIAPGAPLTLQDATVITNQIAIELPIR